MRQQLEKDLQAAIKGYLTARGIFHFKVSTTGIYRKSTDSYIPNPSKGVADIICCLKPCGKFISIEVKNGRKGVMSDEQLAFKENVFLNGGIALVVRSLDDAIEQVEDCIKRLVPLQNEPE